MSISTTRNGRTILAWRNFGGWLWLIGLVVLPIMTDSLRVEAFESPRATLSIVLSLGIGISALVVWRNLPQADRQSLLRHPLTVAVMAWAVSMTISAIVSLSPSRSILGDLQRRMGVLTQWSLLSALVGGALLTRQQRGQCWQLLGMTGCLVAVYGFLQGVVRPSSTFGVATFAASWTVIVILWLGTAFVAHSVGKKRGKFRLLLIVTLIVLVAFLVATQTRAAILGLMAGLAAMGATWTLTHRHRLIGFIFLSVVGLGLGMGIAVYTGVVRIDWAGSLVTKLPLLARLNSTNDGTSKFRLLLWASVLKIAHDWPTMIAINGQADQLSSIRPLIGYGQEMFEFVERPYIDADLRATFAPYEYLDRAHNLWLDTLMTQGALGLASLAAVYLTAIGTCLRVLHQQGTVWGERGWIAAAALAIVVAHAVDLQFSFPSVASEWPFWATLGVLIATAQRPVSSRPWPVIPVARQSLLLVPLTGWLLAWPLAIQIRAAGLVPESSLSAVGMLTLVLLIFTGNWRVSLLSAVVSTAAILVQRGVAQSVNTALDNSPMWLSAVRNLLVADHVVMLSGIGVIVIVGAWSIRRWMIRCLPMTALLALAMSIAGLWWVGDASADSLFQAASGQPDPTRTTLYLSTLSFKTPDDRLTGLAGSTAVAALDQAPANLRQAWLESGCNLIRLANSLNPYETGLSLPGDKCNANHSGPSGLTKQ